MRNLAPRRPPSAVAGRIGSSAIRDLLHLTERPEVLSLAGGLPAPEGFPAAALAEAAAELLADTPDGLQYATTEGRPDLRHWVASRTPAADADRVLVTHGAQQAIDLVARAVAGPGDTVVLPDPGYVGAIQALRATGARLVGVPVDDDGLAVDVLADQLAAGLRPRLVYVVADLDNPTGTTLAEDRRRALVALAEHHGFWILEDDPYGALRWSGTTPVPLAGRSDRVVSVGTTSKILAPGLRVGWVVAEAGLARDLVVLKQATDLHTSALGQALAAAVLTRPGFLPAHLDTLRARYRERAAALATALLTHLGPAIAPAPPEGGMFTWLRLPGVDTGSLLDRALAEGMAFVPGAAFAVTTPATEALRLSFATAAPAEIDEAVRRLARALDANGAAPEGRP